MGKVLLISREPAVTAAMVQAALEDSEELVVENCASEGLKYLEDEQLPSILLLDNPSGLEDVSTLISHVNEGNNFLLSVPILLLTDSEHLTEDEAYLGESAVDMVRKPFDAVLMRNRMKMARKLVNSVSFSEFAQMLKALPANIYLKDSRARYVFSSQTWHHLDTGGDPNWTIRGKTDLDIRKDKENARKALESDLALMRTGKGTAYIIEENDQEQEFLQIIKEPLFAPDGRVRGIIALINNVTEQELLRRELRRLSTMDALTGTYNRAYLREYIEELEKRPVYPLAIITADCDNLKVINDTYGHLAGDEYIRLSVTLMRKVLPEQSAIFRTGGDEFVILLEKTDEEAVKALIEKLEEGARQMLVGDHTLSVSMGYALMTDAGQSISDCLSHSDKSMYENKRRKKAERSTAHNG